MGEIGYSCWWWGRRETRKYYWCLRIQIEKTFVEGFEQYLSSILHVASFHQAILLLGIYPKKIFAYMWKDEFGNILVTILLVITEN